MTYDDAVKKARRRARKTGREYFVIRTQDWERETPYDVCNDFDLDTFYSGTPETDIVWNSFDNL